MTSKLQQESTPMVDTTAAAASETQQPPAGGNYYDKGSVELAVETPVMRKRLEKVCLLACLFFFLCMLWCDFACGGVLICIEVLVSVYSMF
jgi:di/tricarboxylate transporter